VVNIFKTFMKDESGIAAVEYAVIGSFMGLALLPLLPGISKAIEDRIIELAEFF
jgi:Flp pilus assembly pilin Flp